MKQETIPQIRWCRPISQNSNLKFMLRKMQVVAKIAY